MTHPQHRKALAHLRRDPVMRGLIQTHPIPSWERKSNLFGALLYEIIGQQLSGRIARIIFGRVLNLFQGQVPQPEQLIKIPDHKLRRAGCSWAKAKYLKALAKAVENGSLDLKNLRNFDDEEVRQQLTQVKGIGPWTAEMFLIFTLHRPDIFSVGDLGLCTAVSRLYKVRRNNLKKIEEIAQTWKPYRSFASRYLWLSLNNQ